jgi:hypothetical protein
MAGLIGLLRIAIENCLTYFNLDIDTRSRINVQNLTQTRLLMRGKPTHKWWIPIVIPVPLRGLVIAGTGSILKGQPL